jgi:hypothetical protein
VSLVKLSDHLFAIGVHGAILVVIVVLVTATSCQQKPPAATPDPVAVFFKQLLEGLDFAGAESVVVIAVDDNIGAGEDLQRQVLQEIQSRLHQLATVSILEYPKSVLEQKFTEMGITPADGISPPDAMRLASDLHADALLYASIESEAPDVHMKLYSGESGAVVFAETLQSWPLPVTKEEQPLDLLALPGSGASTQGGESEGGAAEGESSGTSPGG